ncbi:MAG: STAS domain-containing protein [Actinomycetota bacterium]|nr:STAS domain-containing protein [Actinomycetota bacterium]
MASDLVDRPNPEFEGGSAQPLTVTIGADDDHTVVLTLAGEVDLATIEILRACLEQASSGAWSSVVVDLEGVSFFDSTGLATIAAANRSLSDAGRAFGLRRPTDAVQRVLVVTGMGDLILD